ncbi:RNA 2',3'-cyclic phosphodiesterase [Paracoccaceae bacterium Fryx2]|nr:RNA 2',3'-cyclic phosphodiesterase [Paracoccaceae bacterium Fryx2]
MIRVFLALDLPGEARDRLSVLQYLLPLPRRVDADNLHLTLAFLGEVPDAVLEAAHEAFAALRLPGFDLNLTGAGLFGGDRPRVAFAGVAPCPPLDRLQAKVEQAARRAGAEVPARRFIPHVTLGRFAPPPPPEAMALERAVAERAGFRAGPLPVRDFVLFETVQGKRVWYRELARYALDAEPA